MLEYQGSKPLDAISSLVKSHMPHCLGLTTTFVFRFFTLPVLPTIQLSDEMDQDHETYRYDESDAKDSRSATPSETNSTPTPSAARRTNGAPASRTERRKEGEKVAFTEKEHKRALPPGDNAIAVSPRSVNGGGSPKFVHYPTHPLDMAAGPAPRPRARPSAALPVPVPVPVPSLAKKGRGRRVPTVRSLYGEGYAGARRASTGGNGNAGEMRAPTRMYMCNVPGCGKCFARGEHLKRHGGGRGPESPDWSNRGVAQGRRARPLSSARGMSNVRRGADADRRVLTLPSFFPSHAPSSLFFVKLMLTHPTAHKCPFPECGKDFSRRDNLGQHMRLHKDFAGRV
ncbi:hypothetical protein B0H14DRAFT_3435593 [Mycena olivaceomarginata]|nr:hypothetical protein B0H14DRAFT_3435593 [Mycena olivaceomarginata]